MRKLNSILVFLLFLVPVKSFCQHAYAAKLEGVEQNGFYYLIVEPELSRYLDPSLKDLRIVNAKGTPVPYVINTLLPALPSKQFPFLPILEYSVKDSGRSHLVLENNTKQPISGIALIIANANVSRTASISGSNDGKTWFTIMEHFDLTGGKFSDSTRFILTFGIPRSSYRYLKLIISNLNNDPLNIVQAGTYSPEEYSKWMQLSSTTTLLAFSNPDPQIIQSDSSDGNSYIRVIQKAAYHINTIDLEAKNPGFYRRRMEVIVNDMIYDFLLTATDQFTLPRFAAKEFLIKIYNGDNPPVKITRVTTSQEKKQVVAFLESGQQYELLMSDPNATAPSYDLEYFRDSISNVKQVTINGLRQINTAIQKKEKESNLSLWLIIIGVLGILSFFTWNLTKELKKRKQ